MTIFSTLNSVNVTNDPSLFETIGDIICIPGGGWIVPWIRTRNNGFNSDLYFKKFDSSGILVSEISIIPNSLTELKNNYQLTDLNSGGILLSWTSNLANSNNTYYYNYQKINFDGVSIGNEIKIPTNQIVAPISGPSVLALGDGGWVSVIDDKIIRFSGEGGIISQGQQLSTAPSGGSGDVRAILLPDGSWLFVWSATSGLPFSSRADLNSYGVYQRRFDANGNPLTNEELVNSTTNGDQRAAKLALLKDGGWIVVWHSDDRQSPDAIFQQRYNASGQKIGNEVRVTPGTSSDETLNDVTDLDGGGWAICYTVGSTLTESRVYIDRYDSAGVKIGSSYEFNPFLVPVDGVRYSFSNAFFDKSENGDIVVAASRQRSFTNSTGNNIIYEYDIFQTKLGSNGFYKNLFNGTNSDDIFYGSYVPETILGFGGNDVIYPNSFNDSIDGGDGQDTLNYSNYGTNIGINLSLSSDGSLRLANVENVVGSIYSDRITGSAIDNVLFGLGGADEIVGLGGNDLLISDGPLSLTSAAQSIRRLYIATLDRAPDDAGWVDWTVRRDNGMVLTDIAAGFVNSVEFQTKYGALDNAAFVTQLYRNVLDREPDAGGLAANVNALTSGLITRTEVVVNFSESPEFKAGTSPELHAGQIFRLYGATLARTPDVSGFKGWTDALGNGQGLAGIAAGFVNSTEFQTRYGSQDSTGFVTLLYQNVLGRAPDAGGLSYWRDQLETGTQSRTQVVIGFSESGEYINRMRPSADVFMRGTMLEWNDKMSGGQGDDMLTGGRGADFFFFRATEAGNDTIYGFESFDRMQFAGFGFANSAAALAGMSQQGANVVFSYANGSITFADTQLSTLQSMTAQGWVFS
jgi:Ca2+-binding RTX toxin-like protein